MDWADKKAEAITRNLVMFGETRRELNDQIAGALRGVLEDAATLADRLTPAFPLVGAKIRNMKRN